MSSSDQPSGNDPRPLDGLPPGVNPKMVNNSANSDWKCDIRVEPLDGNAGYLFRFLDNTQFVTQAQVMHAVKSALVEYLDGRFLSTKYAAMIESVDLQVIHDPGDLVFYYDPLMIFRNQRDWVNQRRTLVLLRAESRSQYFRKKRHVNTIADKVDSRRGKTVSVRTHPSPDQEEGEQGQ